MKIDGYTLYDVLSKKRQEQLCDRVEYWLRVWYKSPKDSYERSMAEDHLWLYRKYFS